MFSAPDDGSMPGNGRLLLLGFVLFIGFISAFSGRGRRSAIERVETVSGCAGKAECAPWLEGYPVRRHPLGVSPENRESSPADFCALRQSLRRLRFVSGRRSRGRIADGLSDVQTGALY